MKLNFVSKLKKTLKWAIIMLPVLAFISIIWANVAIEKSTKNCIYNHANSIPHNKVGLLLGTSKYISNGWENLYYRYRINATYELIKNHKIDFLVISGDNSTKHYNEPESMKNDLVKLGVPDSIIYLDYAGFRTYDSVIRMNKIFGQTNFTIISQQFHNQRAVYIANCLGLNAIAFNAKDVNKYYGFKTKLREQLARIKMFIDLTFGSKPKFLGEKITIK